MNGYPAELVCQHVPLMFVAGLDAPSTNVPPPPTPAKLPTPVPSTRSRERMSIADLPTPSTHSDPFVVLINRLRNALASRKGVVWDSEPGRRFHVVLVDKNVTLPPRKVQLQPATQSAQAPLPPRSPLSPLTPTSPLFPDGLIAPIWIRKHIELVPSVFVLFMRLWEAPAPKSPLEPRTENEEEEKQRDSELAMEIAARKRSTNERGIKLTVVLLASRRALGGLDSRAALFVLSPVSSSELNEFVGSLQDALHESALEYYVAHSKRVRRKRNRHNHSSMVPTSHLSSGSGSGRPLGPQGWSVRYEYKMATFAEFRDEQEVARKHYEDCWIALVDMFGSTALLPPRTKRWAEGKVLADCITVKICKLYLYHNLTNRALSHFNRHLHRFADLSRGWGIGDETYEFWSWMARHGLQIHSLAPPPLPHTLPSQSSSSLGHASKPSISPSPTPAPAQSNSGLSQPIPGAGVNAALSSGINPALVLQHPGFYYYVAAGCSRERLMRFKTVLEAETKDPSPVSATPAFANEQKIDHHSLIVELYTKAYETFKHQKAGQTRLTYFIAYRIAETHYEGGKFDLAVKFFERIARTYRTERWTELLRPALALWYDCARHLADIELSLRILSEMLVPGMTSAEERMNIGEDLMAILKSTAPSSGITPIVVDLSDHEPLCETIILRTHEFGSEKILLYLVDIVPTFWQATSAVNQYVPFQIAVKGPGDRALAHVEFSSMDIKFAGVNRTLTIYHAKDSSSTEDLIQKINLGPVGPEPAEQEENTGRLRWDKDNVLVLCGSVTASRPGEVKIESVTFRIKEGEWTLEFPSRFEEKNVLEQRVWYSSKRAVALRGAGSGVVSFVSPPHKVELSINHAGTTYIGEHYPIDVIVRNTDSRPLYVSLDVLVQPAVDDSQNDITIGNETSSSLIKQPGDRVLDFSVRSGVVSSRAPSPSASPQRTTIPLSPTNDKLLSPSSPTYEDKAFLPSSMNIPAESDKETAETLHMLTIPAVIPFSHSTSVIYERPQTSPHSLLDPATFMPGYMEPQNVAVVNFGLTMDGSSEITIQDIRFQLERKSIHSLLDNTLDALHNIFPMEWAKDDSFATSLRIQTHVEDNVDDTPSGAKGNVSLGSFNIHWKRAGAKEDLPLSISTITLPVLKEPDDELIARAHLPPFAKLHEPFSLHLTIENRGQTRTSDVGITLENTESFVCAGPRVIQIPALLPGTCTDVYLDVIALSVGYVKLPRVRVQDRREEVTRDVPAIAAGWDARGESGEGITVAVTGEDGRSTRASVKEGMYLLVKPN
ncbi:Foie gras liver health family 1 [Rhizoctonia solani]|uniref:Foie gras liver health family 1 n=1 Tax=Rhizoctonia solani TaxID=456999 RepID=A0A8H7I927_9AGAM|nr:Foie gras liver health family 1 [Rhizoctonia solani]